MAGSDDVERRLNSVQDQDDGTLDQIPLSKGELIDELGNAHGLGNSNGSEHALLPDVGSAEQAGQGVDNNENQDTFDWAVDDTKSECLGVVFIPGLDVKGQESYIMGQLAMDSPKFPACQLIRVGFTYKQTELQQSSNPGPCSARQRR